MIHASYDRKFNILYAILLVGAQRRQFWQLIKENKFIFFVFTPFINKAEIVFQTFSGAAHESLRYGKKYHYEKVNNKLNKFSSLFYELN